MSGEDASHSAPVAMNPDSSSEPSGAADFVTQVQFAEFISEIRSHTSVPTTMDPSVAAHLQSQIAEMRQEFQAHLQTITALITPAISVSPAVLPVTSPRTTPEKHPTTLPAPATPLGSTIPAPSEARRDDNPLRYQQSGVDISGEGLCRAFAPHIQTAPVPSKLKSPALPKYQGEGDPLDHLATFTDAMVLLPVSDELLC